MAFEKQVTGETPVSASVEWPDLPQTAFGIKADMVAINRWYFELQTSVNKALDGLADEVDQRQKKA